MYIFVKELGQQCENNTIWFIAPKIKGKGLGVAKCHSGIRIITLPEDIALLSCNSGDEEWEERRLKEEAKVKLILCSLKIHFKHSVHLYFENHLKLE